MNIKIADYNIRISGADFDEFNERFKDYITDSAPEDADLDIDFSIDDNITVPTEKLTVPYKRWQHCTLPNKSVCTMRFDSEGAVLKNIVSCDGKYAKISIANREKIYGMDIWYVSFFAIGEAFAYSLLKKQSAVLHSSSIVLNGSAIAFSAKSGTGKSTHTALWKSLFPNAEIANDDTPVIRFKNGVPHLFGSPFAGTSGINKNISAPLKAVVFLQQGEKNKIEKLSGAKAVSYFLDELKKPIVSDYLDLCMDFTEKIMMTTPVYLLSCTPEKEAVETVMKTVRI